MSIPGIAVARLAGVSSDRGDQRSQVELRSVEQNEEVAGRRAGRDLLDAVRIGEARPQAGGLERPTEDACDVQTGATANRDEDDLDCGAGGRVRLGSSGRLASLRGRE